MIIDIHAHIVDRTYIASLLADGGLESVAGGPGQTLLRKHGHTQAWYREAMFDIEDRLRQMDRQGIDMRVLSLSAPNVYEWKGARQVAVTRQINDATARMCDAHPDRFAGLASLPLDDVEASLAEIDRARDAGFVGVMIGSNAAGKTMNHPDFEPLWAKLDALHFAVIEHPMFPVSTVDMEEFELPLRVGFVFDTTLAATRMIYGGVFERYPNFPYVLAHTGGALLMVLERLDNGYRLFPDCRKYISKMPSEYAKGLYYDTCSFSGPAIKLAIETVGADRLLWGSDDPFIGADTKHVDQIGLPEAQRTAILGGNAAKILGLEGRRR